ncbi:hypothetical protein CBB_A0204 [Clostridium botulinum Bf]|nr:hypothetical protein CBB_A0204 [Clostridium botulinum Bf]
MLLKIRITLVLRKQSLKIRDCLLKHYCSTLQQIAILLLIASLLRIANLLQIANLLLTAILMLYLH